MGLYNFKVRFEQFIRDGRKRHTIRETRKHPDESGNTLHLYIGLRTRNCRLIFRAPCTAVQEIEIRGDGISIDGNELSRDEQETLARRDGFRDLAEFYRFWPADKLPFAGQIIHWNFDKRTKEK